MFTDERVRNVIRSLHAASRAQDADLGRYFGRRAKAGDLDWRKLDADAHAFMADKLVALDADKATWCHLLCRAMRAQCVVEVGTSFGLSTLYLADAVRANGGGRVTATEYVPAKAVEARRNYASAGLADLIDLREGDLRETLRTLEGPIDFVLMDIWTEMARPAIELIEPHMRRGAVIVCDNTVDFAESYVDYFAYVHAPTADGKPRFDTCTVPFPGGFAFSVKR